MRFQLLRFAPDGAPVAPLQAPALAVFDTCTFNARENRYEIELTKLADVLELAEIENVVVKVVPTTGGDGTVDLPILHLIDCDEDPIERACAALASWHADEAVRSPPSGLISLDAAISIVRASQRYTP